MDYTEHKIRNRAKIDRYDLSYQDGKADFYPAYIQIEQTNRCNAECIMCNHFYLGNRGCSDLSADVIEKIEPILPYCETVMLNGDGEPFLCASIEQNIKRFTQYGVKMGTNTNLCFVPDTLWHYFADAFGFLNISCDGATPETFEMIRHGLKWERFLENLAHLAETAPLLIKNFDCVVSKYNLMELPGIVKLAAAYGIRSVRFHRLGVNPCIANATDQAEHYYSLLKDKLASAQSVGQDVGVKVVCPAYQTPLRQLALPSREEMVDEIARRKADAQIAARTMTLADDYYSETVTSDDWARGTWCAGKACQWGIERCYIDVRGNVTTCCFNMKKHMGSLARLTFDEIWNGEAYVAFRRLMAGRLLPGFCKNCNWIKDVK